jgi:hypothetical protein
VICHVRDGNYAAIDLGNTAIRHHRVFDCFHETFPDPEYTQPIADSFTMFLEMCLDSRGVPLVWLQQDG